MELLSSPGVSMNTFYHSVVTVLGNGCGRGGNSVWVWIKGGEANRGKVQMGWKWSVGLLGSAQITGNQMGATHPPLNLQDLASNLSIQRCLAFIIL